MGIFGVNLLTLSSQTSRIVPHFLEQCFRFLTTKENRTKGVFKRPGNEREVQRLRNFIEASDELQVSASTSPDAVAQIVLDFISEIPSHILVDENAEKWAEVPVTPKDDKQPYLYVRHIIKKLPPQNSFLLSRIMAFFRIFMLYHETTEIEIDDICNILAPLLIVNKKDRQWVLNQEIVRIMIKDYKKIFNNMSACGEKKSMISSKKFEEEFFPKISQQFFGGGTMKGLPPEMIKQAKEKNENKKMFRNIDMQAPSWERIIGTMLSRDRRYHAQAQSSLVLFK